MVHRRGVDRDDRRGTRPVAPTAIAAAVAMQKPNVATALRDLSKRGLATQQPNPATVAAASYTSQRVASDCSNATDTNGSAGSSRQPPRPSPRQRPSNCSPPAASCNASQNGKQIAEHIAVHRYGRDGARPPEDGLARGPTPIATPGGESALQSTNRRGGGERRCEHARRHHARAQRHRRSTSGSHHGRTGRIC